MSSTVIPTLEGTTAFVRDRFWIGDLTANANITAGTAVKIAAGSSSSVVATISGTDVLYGITVTNANAGQKVTIIGRGAVRATAQNAMSAGDLVGAAPSGQVVSVTQTIVSTNELALNAYPRGVCIVGTTTSGTTVIVDLW